MTPKSCNLVILVSLLVGATLGIGGNSDHRCTESDVHAPADSTNDPVKTGFDGL
jgi:hypothetical protein